MQNQLKVIDKKVKTYIIFDRVHKTKVEVLKFIYGENIVFRVLFGD